MDPCMYQNIYQLLRAKLYGNVQEHDQQRQILFQIKLLVKQDEAEAF